MSEQLPGQSVGPREQWAWLFLMLLIGLLLIYCLVALWPAVIAATGTNPSSDSVTLFGIHLSLGPDVALIVIVIVVGALGGWVHNATSMVEYIGNRRLVRSWLGWYFMRIVAASPLALIFYFAVRGGLLSTSSTSGDINPYGIAAIAGLVGLFSDGALAKLRDAFAPGTDTPADQRERRQLFEATFDDTRDPDQ